MAARSEQKPNAARIVEGVGVILLGGALVWVIGTITAFDRFMAAGDRCTLEQCSTMNTRIRVLEEKVERLPPTVLLKRVEDNELEARRLQRQIDRLEGEVFVGRRKPPLPPYTSP